MWAVRCRDANRWQIWLDWHATMSHDERMPTKLLPLPAHPLHEVAGPIPTSPCHLPAVAHVAADIDNLTVPVRVVPAAELGVCVECASGRNLDVLDALMVVRAVDAYGHDRDDEVCPLHLDSTISRHTVLGREVVVDVPATGGRQWFERSPLETFYAVHADSPMTGVAVTRGMWDAWQVVDVTDGHGSITVLATFGLLDGESYEQARERAEGLAQDVAARRAADLYEGEQAQAETQTLPVIDVERAA